jgi:hypothetical protein
VVGVLLAGVFLRSAWQITVQARSELRDVGLSDLRI